MDMSTYAAQCQPELRQLIRDLCAIPAPSHHEQQRAEFCRDWFAANCGVSAEIDDALNVICPWGDTENGPVIIEGNDYPGYDFWQLPAQTPEKRGMLPRIMELVPEFKR